MPSRGVGLLCPLTGRERKSVGLCQAYPPRPLTSLECDCECRFVPGTLRQDCEPRNELQITWKLRDCQYSYSNPALTSSLLSSTIALYYSRCSISSDNQQSLWANTWDWATCHLTVKRVYVRGRNFSGTQSRFLKIKNDNFTIKFNEFLNRKCRENANKDHKKLFYLLSFIVPMKAYRFCSSPRM